MEEPQPEAVESEKVLTLEGKLKRSYDALGRVRVTFRTEVAIPNASKIELFFAGHQKLWEVKARMG